MRCQYFISEGVQCGNEATRRAIVRWNPGWDPLRPGEGNGRLDLILVCDEHDPNPQTSMPLPRPPGSTPIGQRPRRKLYQDPAASAEGRHAAVPESVRTFMASPPDRPGVPVRVRRCGTPPRRVGRAVSCSPPADPRPQP